MNGKKRAQPDHPIDQCTKKDNGPSNANMIIIQPIAWDENLK